MNNSHYGSGRRLLNAYAIISDRPEVRRAEAERIARNAVCSAGGDEACGKCRDCRKSFNGLHPDIINVGPEPDKSGKPRKSIVIDQIRDLSTDALIAPNESSEKVYIIEPADTMNIPAQNAALKLLEDPPAHVHFILCAANAELLLPTVRSRCAVIFAGSSGAVFSDETIALVSEYYKAVTDPKREHLFAFCSEKGELPLSGAQEFFRALKEYTADILAERRSNPGLTREELHAIYRLGEKNELYAQSNVGVKHLFGLLMVNSPSGSAKRGKTN